MLNQDVPRGDIPVRLMGRIPVIARLVTDNGVEFWPGAAIRWTRTHVMVCLEEHTEPRIRADYLWLRAGDVVRVLRLD